MRDSKSENGFVRDVVCMCVLFVPVWCVLLWVIAAACGVFEWPPFNHRPRG